MFSKQRLESLKSREREKGMQLGDPQITLPSRTFCPEKIVFALFAKVNTETQIKTPRQQFHEFLFHFPKF